MFLLSYFVSLFRSNVKDGCLEGAAQRRWVRNVMARERKALARETLAGEELGPEALAREALARKALTFVQQQVSEYGRSPTGHCLAGRKRGAEVVQQRDNRQRTEAEYLRHSGYSLRFQASNFFCLLFLFTRQVT